MAAMGADKPPALVITSMLRARFCEALSACSNMASRSTELFLTGLLSIMDAILERPMGTVLRELPVSSDIKDALLGGGGGLHNIYDLVMSYERGDWARTSEIAACLELSESDISESYLSAVKWAHDIFRVGESCNPA
jgi:EAL and modified HD-GYP domain-containing signal transduction protein